jgi:hypothetical protein
MESVLAGQSADLMDQTVLLQTERALGSEQLIGHCNCFELRHKVLVEQLRFSF